MSDAAVAEVGNAAAAAPPPEVPQESPSPASDPRPVETPATPEPPVAPPQPAETPASPTPQEVPPHVTDRSSERSSATPPPSPELSPALRPGPTPGLTIKDRLYAALEKIRFNKRKKLDKIVELARHKGRIKNDDVQIAVRVSDTSATNYLNQLVREGRLKRVGSAAHAWYEPA